MADSNESLLLRLGLDASAFTKGTRDARKELGVLEKGVGSLKSEMASLAAQAAAGIGLALLAREALAFAEAVTKVSQQTGLSIESVQFLRLAADQTGTSVDSLAGMVNKLQRQLVEAGDNDKLRAKIEGIVGPIENLRALAPEQQLQKVADAIASINDPAERTAAAVTLLGKSGAEAIPELTELSKNSDALAAAFERTGGAVSGDTIAAVEGLGDAIGQTKTAVIALATELLGTAAPALRSFLETATEVVAGLRLLDGQGDNAFVNLDSRIIETQKHLDYMRETNPFPDEFMKSQIAAQEKVLKGLEDEYNAMQGLGLAGAERAKRDAEANNISKQMMADASASLMASLSSDEGIRDAFRELRFEKDTALEDRLIAMRIAKQQEGFEAAMAERETENQFLLDLQAQTDQALASGMEEASNLKIQTWQQETKNIAGLLVQQTEGVTRHSKLVFEINKAAGIANSIINTIGAITTAWRDYGWPIGAVVGAAIAVAGAAQVQQIASTKFGSNTSPSQAGTPATPTAPQGGGGGGGGGDRTLHVTGVSAGSLLTGTMVRQLAGEIGDFVKDGGKVEWAN